MSLKKCLEDYTDDEIFKCISDRQAERRIPNIKKQLVIFESLRETAKELKEYPIDDDGFSKNRTRSFITFIESPIRELNLQLRELKSR